MRNPETTALRNAVVAEWNKAEQSMSGVGAVFDISRFSVGRLLAEARRAGAYVYSPSAQIISARCSQAQRMTMPESVPGLLAAGWPASRIAKKFSVSAGVSSRWAREAGYRLRHNNTPVRIAA